jgi:hypothetical protein
MFVFSSGHVGKEKIFRIHAASRLPKAIPVDVMAISNISPKTLQGSFYYPPVAELKKYSVLVVTLFTAGGCSPAKKKIYLVPPEDRKPFKAKRVFPLIRFALNDIRHLPRCPYFSL